MGSAPRRLADMYWLAHAATFRPVRRMEDRDPGWAMFGLAPAVPRFTASRRRDVVEIAP